MPQLPQVSHGASSTRSSTVLLGAVTGVGVGEGEGEGDGEGKGVAGVGAGTTLAVVEELFPPQDTSANAEARIIETKIIETQIWEQEWTVRRVRKRSSSRIGLDEAAAAMY